MVSLTQLLTLSGSEANAIDKVQLIMERGQVLLTLQLALQGIGSPTAEILNSLKY